MYIVNISLVASIFSMSITTASAAIIDFEELEASGAGLTRIGGSYSEEGFTLQSTSSNLTSINSGTFRYSGSVSLFHNTVGAATTLASTAGNPFDLISIDLGELNSNSVANVSFLTDTGFSQTFTLDGNAFGLETFNFNSNFLGISSVTWTQDTPFHQFDNIVVNASPVPEPSTHALMLGGLALVGSIAARRKTQST